MERRQRFRMVILLLGAIVASCSGSGSSGFDAFPGGENAAISRALEQQRCVEHQGLTICPAGASRPGATASPTPTPTSTPPAGEQPTGTPTDAATDSTRTPTVSATVGTTPSRTVFPTGTPSPSPDFRVDIKLDTAAPILCAPVDASTPCGFLFSFDTEGFPAAAVFRVAVREIDSEGVWRVGDDAASSGTPDEGFRSPVEVPFGGASPAEGARIQVAVLAFLAPPEFVPEEVDQLFETGADFAYVTGELAVLGGF